MPTFPSLVQAFFCERLIAQRNASPRTVASYRDALRLLVSYTAERLNKQPTSLSLADLDEPLVSGFLRHLEVVRGNSARSRNARLAAIRTFLRYAAFRDPASLGVVERTLAIPTKRYDRPALEFLSREEVEAILAAPDRSTWSGQRDHVLFSVLYNTGARVSEIVNANVADLVLDRVRPFASSARGVSSALCLFGEAPEQSSRTG